MTRSRLVITGAGASTALGVGSDPIPMMAEWATSLVGALGARADQVGIKPNMPGNEFEAALGKFLAFAKALPLVDEFGYFGNTSPNPTRGKGMEFQGWYARSREAVDQVMNDLHANLYENFGLNRVDQTGARDAYHSLHHQGLRWGLGETRIWHATTNFDPALETAIDLDGSFELVDGFTRPPGGGTRTYEPERFQQLAASGENLKQVPVLHLHGAVGWYYDDENKIVKEASDRPYAPGRTAALLLPDDTKNPATFQPGLDSTWTIFQWLLSRATHVLVLGHSLTDKHLVGALKGWSGNHMAFVKYQDCTDNNYEPPTDEEVEQYARIVGRTVSVIPGKFGRGTELYDFDLELMQEWSSG